MCFATSVIISSLPLPVNPGEKRENAGDRKEKRGRGFAKSAFLSE
jgi:hypothetical protein